MGKHWQPGARRRQIAPDSAFAKEAAIARRIESHMALVRRIARTIARASHGAVELDEIIQAGMVALVEAARTWDDRGFAFATYAQMRVRGAMIDHLRRTAPSGRAIIARRQELAALQQRLRGELGREASDQELADAKGLSLSQWITLVDSAAVPRIESLDSAYSEENAAFADPTPAADDLLLRAEGAALLAEAIGRLPEREAIILQLYFVEELSLDEIGHVFDIGAARVCQIKKAALGTLRTMLAPPH